QIDVRERLAVSTGYGVAEIVVHGDGSFIGKTLGESGLRDRDITVLTLHRGTQVIPNPFPHHVLAAEDRLLCFGKLEEMRSMIPSRPKRRARVKKLPKQPILED
ncbi:MAG TPA: TrkA C-terminal domain-containing protein, partial [Nocardioides sp.]|nr:TrkA C-terminal domain-containing protein [Nocardioides sp.]